MLSVLFSLPSMKGAGAQRTILNLVNNINREIFNPVLVLFEATGSYLSAVRSDVEIVDLGVSRARHALLPLTRYIKKTKPDIVFSTMLYANAVTVISAKLAGLRGPVIVRETNNWTAAGRRRTALPDRVVGWAYRHADAVICLSKGVAEDCRYRYGIAPERIHVIYNPIDIDTIEHLAGEEMVRQTLSSRRAAEQFRVLVAGRLVRQKGFDLLFEALARLGHINWHLTVLGEGEERRQLEDLANHLGIQERVLFAGFQDNPYAWMANSDLFVLSSRWEGFGHVIAEAMAVGVPVLATRCPSGPDEIITDGVDGKLCSVNSIADLAQAIEELAQNPILRRRYAGEAKRSVRRFHVTEIARSYESLFMSTVRSGMTI